MRSTQKLIGLTVIAAMLAACGQTAHQQPTTVPPQTKQHESEPQKTSAQDLVTECAKIAEMSEPEDALMNRRMLHQYAPMHIQPIAAAPATAEISSFSRPQPQSKSETRQAESMIGLSGQFGTFSVANRQPENTEKYGQIDPNPVHAVAQSPISTFSVDVDTGSYANVRRFLNKDNRLPPTDAVRIEELINYFDYNDAQPRDNKPFAVHTEVADSPWKTDAKLIRIGIKAQDIAAKQLPPANLVFLVDTSGSMFSPEKLPLVKQTLCVLTQQLRPQDKVSLVTYAGSTKVALEGSSDKAAILAALKSLTASGSTHGESGIQLAYQQAQKHFIPNGINRILLATDGDFNVGITDFNALKDLAAEKRKSGVSLTTLGYGTGNYNEHLMEQLADAGDGNYSYIDNIKEAQKVLQRQLSSTLATVAQDVKIQVEFNPATVQEYRLVGYENRMLKQEDFNNDKVDAGDIGAGHSVTAIYEIVPTGKQGWLDKSRYQDAPKVSGSLKEYGFVKLRYKKPNTPNSLLIEQPIAVGSKPLARASNNMQWAVAVASYGQQLQGGKYNGNMTWADMLKLAQNNAKPDPYGLREEFISLLQKAQSLSSQAK